MSINRTVVYSIYIGNLILAAFHFLANGFPLSQMVGLKALLANANRLRVSLLRMLASRRFSGVQNEA
jgi:hypothetical protein